MQEIWAQAGPGGANIEQVLRFVTEKSARFDGEVRRRNIREWIGGVVGVGMIAYYLTMAETPVEAVFGLSMGVFIIAVCVLLWRKGRSDGPVDPSLSRPQYRAAVEEKFKKQIRVISSVKYWFAIPLLSTAAATIWVNVAGSPGPKDFFYLPLLTVGLAAITYFNGVAVKQANRQLARLQQALDESETEQLRPNGNGHLSA